ncbi:MAG: MtrB/PioB family outer membrane beta-barrel protein, partial [Xanthobacteraceae bacterium]
TVLPWTIGIDRDTAAASYRWTPGSDWDFNLDYSRMTRTGTQPTQVGEGATTTIATPTQVMKPVDDTTQNYGSKGEYVGSSPWGGRYVLSVGYDGSQYQDRWSNFVVQGNLPSAAAKYAYVSTWPSNQANAFSSTLTADLPWQSRYAGTLSYTMMTQNAAFPQMSPVANPYVLAAPNLDGDINTLLSNNVVTTKIASDLTAKTSFRYYDFKNNTPTLGADATESGTGSIDKNAASAAVTVNSLSMAYIKTNIGEALNWRPSKEWNLGAAYGFERYDWTRADADVTNENSGKVFADWKPWTWLTSRASTEFSVRRYENYDYYNYVGNFQWSLFSPYVGDYANSERQFYLDNRQLWKANYSLDVVVLPNVTITPWTKYQDANYGVDPLNQQGLQDQKSWDFGVDGVYVVSPDLSFMASYSRMSMAEVEYGSTQVNGSLAGPYYYNPGNQTITNESNVVNTFVTAVKYTPIPGKLDTELRYTAAHGVDDLYLLATTAATAVPSTGGQFPENKTWFQRLDATATYKFDPQQVAALGWKGDIKAKLHYTWESNSESNWANDPLAFNNYTAPAGLWLGWYNPNYNVQMLSASLIASW